MKDYKKKKRTQKFFSSSLGRFLIFAVIGALIFPVFKIYLKSRKANNMNAGVGQELVELQAKKEFLQAEIARLKTESGKEEEARKKFNISKPGEELLIITDKKEASTSNEKNDGSFWQRIKDLF